MTLRPVLSLQTGTLYASNDASSFTGTGGPWGFSPFTSQFGGVVSSAGLAAEPFNDTVYQVSPGDEVTFVLAVQDTTPGTPAYNVRVQSALPTGFVVPPEGVNLTVTDGAGDDLGYTGNLFSVGLQITPPLAGYDDNSGGNVVLVTYTLEAGPTLPGPYATVVDTASITHVAASPGGADVSQATPSATTTVATAAPAITAIPETDPSAVAKGQLIAFDVTIPIPAGTLHDLRLDTVLPSGAASLALVGETVLSTGTQLTLGTPQVSGGGVLFGDVSSAGTSDTAADAPTSASIVVQLQLRADGTASGLATVDAVVSALDPSSSTGGRWTADVASSVGVVVTPPSPVLSGLAAVQDATSTMTVRPFANLHIAHAAPDGVGTLAITLGDGTLGSLVAGAGGTVSGGGSTFLATGTLAALQDAAQHLLFTASGAGTERFNLTVVDGIGGVVQNSDTAVAVAPSLDGAHAVAHNAPLPQVTDAAGQTTVAEGEAYTGAVNYLQSQYIYDGAQPATIIAQTPGMFIKNLAANATIALQSGRNVIDAGVGSNVLIGGSGTDSFFVDARGGTAAWDTVANFHAGDVATIFGFRAGTSKYSWTDNAGIPGETGRTLRVDLAGNGQTSASLTFAGLDRAASSGFVLSTGQAGGVGYLTVMAR